MNEPKVIEQEQSTEFSLPVKAQNTGYNLVFNDEQQYSLAQLYQSPYGESGSALDGLLQHVEALIKQKGVSASNLRPGMLAFLVPVALKLGYPLAFMFNVKDSTAAADHLLSTCMRLAPKEWFVDISHLKEEALYNSGEFFSNKVLVCRNPVTVKKIEPDLLNLIMNGYSTRQALSKSKYGSETREYHVKGPVGFIGIETEAGCGMFNHPAILRLKVVDNHGREGTEHDLPLASGGVSENSIDFEIAKLTEYLSRFGPRKVTIPFQPRLFEAILRKRPADYRVKTNIIKKILSSCTILNNPPQITGAQLMAKLYNSRVECAEDWLIGRSQTTVRALPEPELCSGETEYRVLKNLLDGLIPVKDSIPSVLEIRLFEIIKTINFSGLNGLWMSSKDVLEQLYVLNKAESCWERIEHIFKVLNTDPSRIIPLKVIEAELVTLRKRGLIERKKYRDKDEHGYYVTVFEVDQGLKLPDAGEIFQAEPEATEV